MLSFSFNFTSFFVCLRREKEVERARGRGREKTKSKGKTIQSSPPFSSPPESAKTTIAPPMPSRAGAGVVESAERSGLARGPARPRGPRRAGTGARAEGSLRSILQFFFFDEGKGTFTFFSLSERSWLSLSVLSPDHRPSVDAIGDRSSSFYYKA